MSGLESIQERYVAVMDSVDPAERERIQGYRQNGDTGSYGHDMVAAIFHGYANRANDALEVALWNLGKAASYGQEHERRPSVEFASAASRLVDIAANRGVDEASIRRILQRLLDAEDHFAISQRIERANNGDQSNN